MYGSEIGSSVVRRTGNFDLPIKRKRDKHYRIEPGMVVFTCLTSDFFIADADEWRKEAWNIIRQRSDVMFFIFTKRIDRFMVSIPDDWGDGYDNVIIGCTTENQEMADYRLPIFKSLPIKHKEIICAPLISAIDLSRYLDDTIEEVSVGGESGVGVRICDYDWVLDIRRQCVDADVSFRFHQTGARLMVNGIVYRILRGYQIAQAEKAGINYKIGIDYKPYK